jgi:hypothetical protein
VQAAHCRIVLALLDRNLLLGGDKERGSGQGAYQAARWHAVDETCTTLGALPAINLRVRTEIFLASGSRFARTLERTLPSRLHFGGSLFFSGDVER